MGAEDGDADEKPVHSETVRTFFMDRTEVTVRAYEACVQAGGCKPAATTVDWPGISEGDRKKWSPQCNAGKADRRDHPINCVTWAQAGAFCKWAGKRLPTEAEWEYAARGKEGRKYPWGSEAPGPTLLNACGAECVKLAKERGWGDWSPMYSGDDGWPTTAPVGRFPAGKSPFELLDMAGNVWEWTDTPYCGSYSKKCANTSLRVARGGSWFVIEPSDVRGANRSGVEAVKRNINRGFRCARTAS
jgi:formylglycine-generating enzyme required for sulfatase activity